MNNFLEDIAAFCFLALVIVVPFVVIFLLIYFLVSLAFSNPRIFVILLGSIPFFIVYLNALGKFLGRVKWGYYSPRATNYRKIKEPVKHLEYTAKFVYCNQVLGGNIIQFTFEENTTKDYGWDPKRFLKILINHEDSPSKLSLYWYDGREGKNIDRMLNLNIERTSLKLRLEDNIFIKVDFNIDSYLYSKIESNLKDLIT